MIALVSNAGRFGNVLVRTSFGKNKKHKDQYVVDVTKVDWALYEPLFADTGASGPIESHRYYDYPNESFKFDTNVEAIGGRNGHWVSREVVAHATEIKKN